MKVLSPRQTVSSQTEPFEETVSRKEIYNEYYEGDYESSLASSGLARKNNNYYLELRASVNSKVLINEIFENETNRALLKMERLRGSSRDSGTLRRYQEF